jgi:hypothetical protein
MARRVERRIKATVTRTGGVILETATGDGLGVFEIPAGKDPDEHMRHAGYVAVGRDEWGAVWIKAITLT